MHLAVNIGGIPHLAKNERDMGPTRPSCGNEGYSWYPLFPSLSNHALTLNDMDVAVGWKIGQFLDLLARTRPVNLQLIDLGCCSNPQHFTGIVRER